jgi:SWI/SNF-related matrix-associated actin-dependent regulator 1 of chromatin subfamily A
LFFLVRAYDKAFENVDPTTTMVWPINEVQLAQVSTDKHEIDPEAPLELGCRIVAMMPHLKTIQRRLDAAQIPSHLVEQADDDVSGGGGSKKEKAAASLFFEGHYYPSVMNQIRAAGRSVPSIEPLPQGLVDLLEVAAKQKPPLPLLPPPPPPPPPPPKSGADQDADEVTAAPPSVVVDAQDLKDQKDPQQWDRRAAREGWAALEAKLGTQVWSGLKPYQRSGVAYVWSRGGRALLADGMGLGKTAQAIASMMLYREKWPVLVVAPSSVRYNLRQEFMHWARLEEHDVVVIQSTEHIRRLFGSGPAPAAQPKPAPRKKQPRPSSENGANDDNKSKQRQTAKASNGMKQKTPPEVKVELKALVYIISYDLLARPGLLAALEQHRFKCVVFDEAHYLKHMTSRRTRCALQLAWRARHVVLMSGTPGVNPAELYSHMLALQPKLWPPWWKAPRQQVTTIEKMHEINHKLDCSFAARWCDPRPERVAGGRFQYLFTGAARMEELHAIGRVFCFIQRCKEDVLRDMPPKRRECIRFSVDEKHRVYMEEALENMRIVREKSAIKSRAIFSKLFAELPQIKLPFVRQYLNQLFGADGMFGSDPTRKVLLFAHHKAMISETEKLVKEKGLEYIVITGETPPKSRHHLVNRFQTDPKCRVAILSMTAAGCGLNLFAASIVVFLESLFGPEVLLQAEDRAHRLGQTRPVDVCYLLATGSVEEIIWRLVQRKQTRAVRLMQDRAGSFSADSTKHVEGPGAEPEAKLNPKASDEDALAQIISDVSTEEIGGPIAATENEPEDGASSQTPEAGY